MLLYVYMMWLYIEAVLETNDTPAIKKWQNLGPFHQAEYRRSLETAVIDDWI